jgi:uncharacterized protein (DUF305 family)
MSSTMSREKLTFFGVLALIVLLVAGGFAANGLRNRTPDSDSAEAGFLRDMQVHHLQAVQMAMIVRDRTQDEQIKSMTTDIAFSQTSQIGQMQGYMGVWDIPPTGDQAPMSWMGHALEPGERMPGMASDEEVQMLRTLPVEQAETLFLQLMTRHHIAGVEMAQEVIDRSDNDEVVDLATSMIRVQNAETQIMNQFLERRGHDPITPENVDNLEIAFDATPVASPVATPAGHEGH